MFKFKDGVKIETQDFWYDLTDGGYIKPEEVLNDTNDIEEVLSAIELLQQFRNAAEEQNILMEY